MEVRDSATSAGTSHRSYPSAPHPPPSRPLLWAVCARPGDLRAWLLDTQPAAGSSKGCLPIVGYQALCRELSRTRDPPGSCRWSGPGRCWASTRTPGSRPPSADARASQQGSHAANAGWSRSASTTARSWVQGRRVRLPVAKGHPAAVGAAGPPHPLSGQPGPCGHPVRRWWPALAGRHRRRPVQQHDLDPGRVAGVDLGIISPYAVVTDQAGHACVGPGNPGRRAAFTYATARPAKPSAAHRAPRPGQRGSRRLRARHRLRLRRVEARHRRRVHQAHHQAAQQVVAFAVQYRIGMLVVGDPTGITAHDSGPVHNLRLRQWRRTHLVQALRDKAEPHRDPGSPGG